MAVISDDNRRIVGGSGTLRAALVSAERAAVTDATVLITGESGTGKELLARFVHQSSPRRNQRFVATNCGALSDALLESELFGHVRGAFTGAVADRRGLFEEAHRGTIFLDEVATMSAKLQVSLLRVLEEREIVVMGTTERRKVDVRVVAATNQPLRKLVGDGGFREDLYYRLDVVSIRLPPLRDRIEDIPNLVDHLLERFARANHAVKRLAPDALTRLKRYHWPGNIRELANLVERLTISASESTISLQDVDEALSSAEREAAEAGIGVARRAHLGELDTATGLAAPLRLGDVDAPRSLGRATKRGSWKALNFELHIPHLLGALIVFQSPSQDNFRARFDRASKATGHMASSTYYEGGQAKIKQSLDEWGRPEHREIRFTPVIHGVPASHRSFNYHECISTFRPALLEWECFPDHLSLPVSFPACAPSGDLWLVRSLPGDARRAAAAILINRERAAGRTVLSAYDVECIGTDSKQDHDLNLSSLCVAVADGVTSFVSRNTLVQTVAESRALLVINGFAPINDVDNEWAALFHLLKRLRNVASAALFQSSDPCHEQAVSSASSTLTFSIVSIPGSPDWSQPRQILEELRPCCRRILADGRFDASDSCVVELIKSHVLKHDGAGNVVPCDGSEALFRQLEGGGRR